MVKNDLLKKIAEKSDFSQKDVYSVLTAYVDVVTETLSENKDEKIALGNLGSFRVKDVPERSGVAALAGGKAWTVPAHSEITFKMSKSAKQLD